LGKVISSDLLELLHDKAQGLIVILLMVMYIDAKILYKKLNFGDLTDRIRICVPSEDYDHQKYLKSLVMLV
jgi:hypothetical protein